MVQELMLVQRHASTLSLASRGVEVGVSSSACQRLSTAAYIVMPVKGTIPESPRKKRYLLLSVPAAILDRRIKIIAGPAGSTPWGGRVHVRSPGDHPQDELTGMPQGFVTGEARRDPVEHRRVLGPPPIGVYAVNRGDRG